MNQTSKRYCYHLDNIRRKKKIKVKDLCCDICGDRQYRRYLSGENNLSDEKIIQFCERLGISPRDFYYSLNEKDLYEYNEIHNLYNKILSRDFTNFNILLDELNKKRILSNQNLRFLDFCSLRYKFDNKKLDREEAYLAFSKNADYPNCLNKEVFDFVDIITIHMIAQIEVRKQKETAMRLLQRLLTDDSMLYLSSETKNILPTIYSSVSLMLGKLKKYEECIKLANEGIMFCLLHSYNKSLTRLYYSNALSYKHLNMQSEAEHSAVLCFANAISRQNDKDTLHFFKFLSKDFNLDPFTLFTRNKELLLKHN